MALRRAHEINQQLKPYMANKSSAKLKAQKASSSATGSVRRHKRLVDMIRGLVGMIEDLGHNGTPPSWSKMPCSKCERVNEAKRLIGDL
jgi:hypothetical protein